MTTRTTHTEPDPLSALLEGHHRWLEGLDISLVRHGIRPTNAPRGVAAAMRAAKQEGNLAGKHPAPATHWLRDRHQGEDDETQPYRETRRDTLAPCRACLVRNVDAHNAQETVELVQMHPKLVFLCADCRDLALEVSRLATERDRVDTPHVLEAFFQHVLPVDGPSILGGVDSVTSTSKSAPKDDPDATVKHPITFGRRRQV